MNMRPLSMPGLIARRLAGDWKIMASIFLGVLVSTTLVAGAPVYIRALDRQGADTAIDNAQPSFLNIFIHGPNITLDDAGLARATSVVSSSLDEHLLDVARGDTRHVRSDDYLVGLPDQPLPERAAGRIPNLVSRGYLHSITNLDDHVVYLEGSPPQDAVRAGQHGLVAEAAISRRSALIFDLELGDTIVMAPAIRDPGRFYVEIVGIIDPIDVYEEFWHGAAHLFFDPLPLAPVVLDGVDVNPEEPPLPLFVTEKGMIDGAGRSFTNTLVTANWLFFLDKERLKEWSTSDLLDRVESMDAGVVEVIPGAALFTGIRRLVADYEQRSFFSMVPLAVLLAVMIMTVIYYLAMMVAYLVQSREGDVALLRNRGVTTMQMLRLYALEGGALTLIAVLIAPLLAYGVVAAAGKLPAFGDITGGDFLPVQLHWLPFAVAAGAGLMGLAVFVVPALVGARASLVIHRLRSSRPPSIPLFQRYYLDIGVLVVGGVVFWELRDRVQVVSGGLFGDVQVNEALLLAPVLLLLAVALLFMRLFPLFVRFISGESPALLNLVAGVAVASLAAGVLLREIDDGNPLGWVLPVLLVASIGGLYWATQRAQRARLEIAGLVLQALAIALFIYREPLDPGELSFVPTVALAALVPAQVAFKVFRLLAVAAPVWVAMGLWHMARNPFQYSWLVLLLVLVTGLGVLSTTVGGTLNKSHQDRIRYRVASDLRVSGLTGLFSGHNSEEMKDLYQTIPGVQSTSLAYRGLGAVGAAGGGNRFELLALESQYFPYLAWYRDDFSSGSLQTVMRDLLPRESNPAIVIPEGAETLSVWVKTAEAYEAMFLWAVISDAHGTISTLTFGALDSPEWRQLTVEIPDQLDHPLHLESIQIFERAFGPAGRPGSLWLDDIQVGFGPGSDAVVLDDFEGELKWTPLATSMISSDRVGVTLQDVQNGSRSGVFSFGKDTDRGIRGFYRSPTGGPLSVVASSSFLNRSAVDRGDRLIISFLGRMIPVRVRDVVDYFPTLNPRTRGFLLTDLDALVRHVNIITPSLGKIAPNEIFIKESSGAGDAVLDIVISIVGSDHRVLHRESMLESVRLDPLVTAGWRAMVVLSIGVILFAAGFGYVTYLLAFAERSRGEMGFLQALGLRKSQIAKLIGLEHIVIVAIGLGLGTWAGFQMSDLMVSSVAITETGDHVVPPFITVTSWGILGSVYAAMAAIFLGALYLLARHMTNLELHLVARVEGN